jgi:cytochrome c
MKKVLGTILVGALLIACGEGKHTAEAVPAQQAAAANETSSNTTTNEAIQSSTTNTSTNAATISATTALPTVSKADIEKGLKLVANSDCLTCHKINEKVIGPAYKEVAKKYASTPANIKMLAGKIIKGGSGNWGGIPMTAHTTLSQADAELMVKYVLSLK